MTPSREGYRRHRESDTIPEQKGIARRDTTSESGILQPGHVRAAPLTEAEREAIRRQLERMLADPLFKNSRRFPGLLRYVVEHTLEGHSAELKERTLGVEVFGRQPNYDTNEDPIVRATAGEIRKRLAQYYQSADHAGEIRIHLFPGSYIPEFELPGTHPPASAPVVPAPEAAATRRHSHFFWPALAAAAIAIVVAAPALLLSWHSPTALDRFWAPVVNSNSTVLVCIGQRSFMATAQEPQRLRNPDVELLATRGPGVPITISEMYYMGSQNVALDDAKTLGRLTGLLQAKGKKYRVLGESSASFSDLRESPVVLIGGFNNDWTMRLTGPMRFSFERDGNGFRIRDQQNPSAKGRSANYDTPYLQLTQDYALISRVQDPTTGRMVIVAAGLTGYGTVAAGELVSDPAYMEAAIKQAPPNWQGKNLQFVLATEVIRGNSGPPRVVDRFFW